MSKKYFVADIPDDEHMSDKTDDDGYKAALKFRDRDNSLNGPIDVKEIDPIDEQRKVDLKIAQFLKEEAECKQRSRQQEHVEAMETIQNLAVIGDLVVQLAPWAFKFGLWCRYTAYPTIKDRTIPWVKNTVDNIANRVKNNDTKEIDGGRAIDNVQASFAQLKPEEFIQLVEKAHYQYKLDVSNEEAQKHFLNLILCAAIIAKEIRYFSEHTVVPDNIKLNEEKQREWKIALEGFATEKMAESINMILQSNPALFDEPYVKQLYESIVGKVPEEYIFIPIEKEDIRHALVYS